jgi:hypothetical protein
MGRGGFPTSTDGFILGPSHGFVGLLFLILVPLPFLSLLN